MRDPARTGRPLGKIVLNKCIKEVYNKGVERMVFKMTLTTWNNETKEYYVYPEAWALYDGGWRKEDWELFKETFICNFFYEQAWTRPMPIYSVPGIDTI
jgi:hypothetical protein|nr:MAG TPA: capsid protein [Microviridae sp.]